MSSRRCGWCETINLPGPTHCVSCGGPLPLPPAADPGPAPPPPPRELPARYRHQKLYKKNFGVMWGAIFGGIGGFLTLCFVVVGVFFPPMLLAGLFSSVFFMVGAAVGGYSLREAQRALAPYQKGRAALATVSAVFDSPFTLDMGGLQVGWQISYTFEVAGRTISGMGRSSDPRMAGVEPGHCFYVVYLPHDPQLNAVWPPYA